MSTESHRFPWYVRTNEDRRLMEVACSTELEGWRIARATRLSFENIWDRMFYRPQLEQAYDQLRDKFTRALALPRRCA